MARLSEMIERAKEYRKLGKEEWLHQQIKKAQEGYEGHTKKYYQIWARKYLRRVMKNEQ